LEQKLHILFILVKLFCALFGNISSFKVLHALNADAKVVILYVDGIVIFDIELQLVKVLAIDTVGYTDVGNSISCRAKQPLNIVFILANPGISIFNPTTVDNEEQFWNIVCEILILKLFGSIIDLRLPQVLNIPLQLNTLPSTTLVGILTYSNEAQLLNIFVVVIVVAPDVNDGISIVIKLEQLANAEV
jgi:hypothetical protein